MTNEEFENLIVSDIITQYPEYADCLEKQYRSAKVIKRENTGRGFFTDYEIAEKSCRIDGSPDLILGKRQWNLNGLKCGSDYILWVKEGLITCLEGFCYGEDRWPDEITDAEIIGEGK